MSETIRVYPQGSEERKMLEAVAEELTKKSPRGFRYYVDETYFDYGQDWMWTTIIAVGGITGSYQALNPRNHEEIIIGLNTPEEMAERILAGKFCPDKIEKGA